MDLEFTYVDTQEKLRQACSELKEEKDIGIDFECENNLHHYGVYIALIQISSRKKNWIMDVIKLKEISGLSEIFSDEKILKVLHDVGFDLRILYTQFHCRPRNIFDTQIAAHFLGKEHLGLGALLEEYFSLKKESKYQKADWTKRPLTPGMLEYAIKDTTYLLELKDRLKEELKEKGRWEWVEEEFSLLERKDFSYQESDFLDRKGNRILSPQEKAIAQRLFELREKIAQTIDRPVHFVISNRIIQQVAKEKPTDLDFWHKLKSVHPLVHKKAELFQKAVLLGMNEELSGEDKLRLRFTPQQKDRIEKINEIAADLANKLGLKKHLLINKEQVKEIVLNKNIDSLKHWQRKLFEDKIKL